MSAVLSFRRAAAQQPSHGAIAYVADAATASAVAEAIPGITVREDGLGAAIGALSQGTVPPVLIVDVSDSDEPVAAIRTLAGLAGERSRIIALGTVNDVALYRSLRDAGAADYLVKPLQSAALAAVVSRIDKPEKGKDGPASRARRLFVCGARGGAGATTVAVNVAWHLSRREDHRVALVDLDLAFGTVALALDIEPSHGLREILENPDRVDALFVSSAAARIGERLSVFAAEDALDDAVVAPARTEASIPRFFEALSQNADSIIVDVPRQVVIACPGILAHADNLVLVSELHLAGARDAARLALLARDRAPECTISLIANKCGKRKGEIDDATFMRGARLEVAHRLPWDEKAAAAAANAGQAIGEAAASSPLAVALARTADALVPAATAATKGPLWKRLVGRS